ncbi:hypothetical protein [Nocardiopsis sp. NRRL B-16309]|uniref:hypothetical protein n=1 Tax=Nocardiopsis sp. NRRL B-16309 TaxID=1519494 RepID=UPI000AA7C74D|nr:hypothetical protein [Nocardiopsis sp. NRRL B-16309]
MSEDQTVYTATHEHVPAAERDAWLEGYQFALVNFHDEPVQNDRARYLAGETDTTKEN